jgi:multisubunit Na+/H+ antiporter MnhE subunit
MAVERFIRPSSSRRRAQKLSWQQRLVLLSMVPLAVGVLLIIGALTGAVVWGTARKQLVMGGFYALFSFVASNLIQKRWVLAGCWTLLGLAVWLVVNQQQTEARIMAAAFLAIAVALLSREFLRRRRHYLDTEER